MEKILNLPLQVLNNKAHMHYIDQYAGAIYGYAIGLALIGEELTSFKTADLLLKLKQMSIFEPTAEIPFCGFYDIDKIKSKFGASSPTEAGAQLQRAIYGILRPIVTQNAKYDKLNRQVIRTDYVIKHTAFKSQKVLRFLAEFDDYLYEKKYEQIAQACAEFAENLISNEDKLILLFAMILLGLHFVAAADKSFVFMHELFAPHYHRVQLIADLICGVYSVYGMYYGYAALPIMPELRICTALNKIMQRSLSE